MRLRWPGGRKGRDDDDADYHARRRREMVDTQIVTRGITHPEVLRALLRVPRHRFVIAEERANAYRDGPLAIGHGQTISQPYIVALMTERIRPRPEMRVLDVGTGSGYQAAVLAECVREVFSIEIVPGLAADAARRLRRLGYDDVTMHTGDGSRGWPDHAPYDAILVAAAPAATPPALLEQLAPGGRLVLPVGSDDQQLLVVTRDGADFRTERIAPVRFVPMTGEARG